MTDSIETGEGEARPWDGQAPNTHPARPEPCAMRFDFDGDGYRYIDSGSGSDWKTRHPDAEPMFDQEALDAAQQVSQGRDALDLICERDELHEVLDAVLDLVLGKDRPEWSSGYGFQAAVIDVDERMAALEKATEQQPAAHAMRGALESIRLHCKAQASALAAAIVATCDSALSAAPSTEGSGHADQA